MPFINGSSYRVSGQNCSLQGHSSATLTTGSVPAFGQDLAEYTMDQFRGPGCN